MSVQTGAAREICSVSVRWASIILAPLLLTGCVVIPQPHTRVELSRVEGRLTQEGQPVPGVRLSMNSLNDFEPCSDPIAFATTDDAGRFVFQEISDRKVFRLVVLAPSSPTYSMSICRLDEGASEPIFTETIWAALPASLTLECDRSAAGDTCQISDWVGYNFTSSSDPRGECRPGPQPTSEIARGETEALQCVDRN